MWTSFPRTATCRLLPAIAIASALAATAAAQDTPCGRRKLLVHAMDKNAQSIAGLEKENFKAEFRGKPAQIVSVKPFTSPTRIVIVMDASGSMQELWKHANFIAAHLTLALRQEGRIALVIFNTRVTHEKGFGTPREDILYLLRALQRSEGRKSLLKGRTALHLGLLRAVEMLHPARTGDLIYLISDGGTDNLTGISDGRVERTLLAAGARFFATVFPTPQGSRRTPEEYGPSDLVRLSETTGGSFLPVPPFASSNAKPSKQEKEVTDALHRLYRQMLELYEVEIELPREVDRPRGWSLDLVFPPGVKKSGTQLLYPQKLLPCMQP